MHAITHAAPVVLVTVPYLVAALEWLYLPMRYRYLLVSSAEGVPLVGFV